MNFENRYSLLDKLLHHLAFRTTKVQTAVADIEDRLYSDRLESIPIDRPVFVTALPRAGTTIVLELLVNSGFASHTYRDMPFVICPMIWHNYSNHFFKGDSARERAHGDGLTISMGSPEALEEVIWKAHWPDHYRTDVIEPWREFGDSDFADFFKSHIRKILAIRYPDDSAGRRYVSKNNLNIARLDVLPEIFRDCIILIPFREPLQHAASLLNQHERFSAMHSKDHFVKHYMEGIGHYEFGESLRPINFDGWLKDYRRSAATTLSFWLDYWLASYRRVLSAAGDYAHFLSFEDLSERPRETLSALAAVTGLEDRSKLIRQANALRVPRKHAINISGLAPDRIQMAQSLYAELCQRSLSLEV